jgi:hypothetical protein
VLRQTVRDELENLLAFGRFYPVFSHENAGFSAQNQLIPKLDADPTRIARGDLVARKEWRTRTSALQGNPGYILETDLQTAGTNQRLMLHLLF